MGGAPLRSMQLSWGMFGADAMRVRGVGLHLTQLKVKQLAEELSERGATKSGRKRALQLRLSGRWSSQERSRMPWTTQKSKRVFKCAPQVRKKI